MQKTLLTCWFFIGFFGLMLSFGQEEGSADLFTESYTDRFQELFFEALKQKSIENFDRAESLLQDAKNLDPLNPVLDYELARVLLLQNRYAQAEKYALDALRAEPAEYWFLETFMEAIKSQNKPIDAYLAQLPEGMQSFHLNLARWYISQEAWKAAEDQLSRIEDSDQAHQFRALISSKQAMDVLPGEQPTEVAQNRVPEEGSAAYYERALGELLEKANWTELQQLSAEAMETYPLQPYFYYAHGMSLLRQGKTADALPVLESGEGMLLGGTPVSSLLYAALMETHSALGNSEKASQYRSKLKSGS